MMQGLVNDQFAIRQFAQEAMALSSQGVQDRNPHVPLLFHYSWTHRLDLQWKHVTKGAWHYQQFPAERKILQAVPSMGE